MRKSIAALLLVVLSVPAFADDEAEIRGAFRQGIDLFEQGRYDDAHAALTKALALRPSADLALELRDQAGYQVFLQMLAREGDIAAVAREILKLARKGEGRFRQDQAWIQGQLARLKSDDIREQYIARENLVSKAGQFVVPSVVEALGDKREDDYRVRVIDLLVALGPDAVLPLTEVLLHSPDTFVRQNAAVVLGHVKDARGVAPLKKVYDSPQAEQGVRAEAGEALRKITGVDPGRLGPAQQYYFDLGHRFYMDDPTVTGYSYRDWGVWEWEADGGLTFQPVPSYAWNERMAQKCCYECLAFDASHDETWSLLVCAYYAQVAEVDETLDLVRDKAADGAVSADEVKVLEEAKTALLRARSINYARGQKQLLRGLKMAMADGVPQVAQRILWALRDIKINQELLPLSGSPPRLPLPPDDGDLSGVELGETIAEGTPRRPVPAQPRPAQPRPAQPQPVQPGPAAPRATAPRIAAEGQPLVDALSYPDKRVRYAAAEALAAANPDRPFTDYARVVDNLVDAIGESGPRTALVIENDANARNRLVGALRNIGLLVSAAENGRQGIDRARSFPAEDVILIAEALPERDPNDINAFDIIDALKADYRTAHVPVLVVADQRKESGVRLAFEGLADGVVSSDADEVRLRGACDAIFGQERFQRDAKAEATEVAKRAARAIAALEPTRTIYPVHRATEALTRAVEVQPDEVKVPAMAAIGRLRVRAALPRLVAAFENKENARDVRVAAAEAIGEVVKPTGEITPSIYAALKAGLAEEDQELRDAAACALGKANLSPEQARQVFEDFQVK